MVFYVKNCLVNRSEVRLKFFDKNKDSFKKACEHRTKEDSETVFIFEMERAPFMFVAHDDKRRKTAKVEQYSDWVPLAALESN